MKLMECTTAIFTPILRRVIVEGEDKLESTRKTIIVPAMLVVGVVSLLRVFLQLANRGHIFSQAYSLALAFFIACGLLHTFITKRLTEPMAIVYISGVTVLSVCLGDITTYSLHEKYTGVVLTMDCILLCRCSETFTTVARNVIVVYILVITLEHTVGLGIFSLIPEEWVGEKRPAPLGTGFLFSLLSQRLMVFLLDFMMTQHFARRMHKEQATIQAVVVTAENIAVALSRFDTCTASTLINESSGLPDELRAALETLVKNLQTYRPYLPQSCLPDELVSSDASEEADKRTDRRTVVSDKSSVPEEAQTCQTHGIQNRTITLVAINVIGFSSSWASGRFSSLEEYLTFILTHVRDSHGLVESFSGDRVLVSFNAAKSCMTHRRRGVECALAVTGSTHHRWSVAVSCGQALCGDGGCEGMKRYTILGTVYPWVCVLERYAKILGLSVLADSGVARQCQYDFHFRLVSYVRYEKNAAPVLIWHPTGAIEQRMEEWMYQLHNSQSIWGVYNTVLEAVLTGKRGCLSRDILSDLNPEVADTSALLEWCHTSQLTNSAMITILTDIGHRAPQDAGDLPGLHRL
eukprot:Sspe_Gene.109396::Locus_89537_Transcript_2_2_Confidence_0.667_Length_2027::g.109396::m.109396